ncbi:thioredoxin [Candidatus Woesearchaeota archaeon]|nr:thioredoxin [Candidatus Woesearchaeota archaeon]
MAVTHLNKENFSKEVEQSDQPVIIDFWAEWCGPCRMMGPVFEELSNDYEGKVKFAKINVDEEPDLAGRFAVQGIPSLVVVKDGNEVDRIVGFAPKEALKDKIDSILGA